MVFVDGRTIKENDVETSEESDARQDVGGDNIEVSGKTGGLDESELNAMQGVRDQIASINEKLNQSRRLSICTPELAAVELSRSKKESKRRASTGEVVRSKTYPKQDFRHMQEARTAENTKTSPSKLLKTYNVSYILILYSYHRTGFSNMLIAWLSRKICTTAMNSTS